MKLLGSKTIETPRLILHKTEEKDLKELWNILCLDVVSKYYLTCKINYNWEDEKKWQYKKLEEASNKDIFRWTIELKDSNEIIGQISVQETDNSNNPEVRDIGWFIDPGFQRKGYGYEAALEVLKYMFLEVEINSIETSAAIVNPSSWKLMEKLGFIRKKTTHFVKYTLLEEEVEVYEYILTKKDFLKEYFRKQELYITEDIDKDPYIKHISDDLVLNITGESGSGKSTATDKYKNSLDCCIIDTDELFSEKENVSKDILLLRNYLIKKYKKLPDLIVQFDDIYKDIIEYFKNDGRLIIIDSAQYRNIKDISILKGDIIVIRTCINNCYNRCIERYKNKYPNATFEEIAAYAEKKKNMYKWYHSLNSFIDKLDKE